MADEIRHGRIQGRRIPGAGPAASPLDHASLTGQPRRHPLEWALALLVVLLPFTLPFSVVLDPRASPTTDTPIFFPVDLGLLVVALMSVAPAVRALKARRLPLACWWAGALAGLTFVAVAVNPSSAGCLHALRMLAVALVICGVTQLGPRLLHGPVFLAILIVGFHQSGLAVAQVATERDLGLGLLGLGDRSSVPLLRFGGVPSARGSFFHVYTLAGVVMVLATVVLAGTCRVVVARPRWLLPAAAFVVAVPLGLTYSRMSLVGVAGVVVAVLCTRTWRRSIGGLSAFLAGVLVPAALTSDGWIARTQASVSAAVGGDPDALASGRLSFAREAGELIRANPWFGVGPANYEQAVAVARPDIDLIYHVHNVPLLVAAEAGTLAGLVMVALLASLGVGAFRSDTAARVLFVGIIPFLLLDVFTAVTAQGLVLFGLWAGGVLALSIGNSGDQGAPASEPADCPQGREDLDAT